jgi:hypothetical protein
MPTYQIKAPDGNTYRIDGPEGASDDQVREQVLKQHPNAGAVAQTATPPVQDRSVADVGEEGTKGLLRGAANFVGTMGEAVMGPFGPSKHFEKLKADITGSEPPKPDPTYGEQITKAAHIEAKPETDPGRYAGAITETLGNPATYAGAGSAALKIALGTISSIFSETAGEFAKKADLGGGAEAALRVGGAVLGGGAGGLVASERGLSKLAAELPGRTETKAASSKIYDALKQSDVRISPPGMDLLTQEIKTNLIQEGARNFHNARGEVTLKLVDELATSGGSITGIDAVRKALSGYKSNPQEALYADMAIDTIDDYFMRVDPKFVMSGNPQEDAQALRYAQSLWATNKQLEIIEEGSIKGQRRAGKTGTGANRINTARQEIDRILSSDKKSRGMSQEAKEKMEEIVLGTWLTNSTRNIGKYAPSGPVSSSTTIAAGFAGGVPAAATVAGSGLISKYLGEYLTSRQIKELEQLIKSESPMGAPVAQAIAPAQAEARALPAAQAARSALTSPLASGGP